MKDMASWNKKISCLPQIDNNLVFIREDLCSLCIFALVENNEQNGGMVTEFYIRIFILYGWAFY